MLALHEHGFADMHVAVDVAEAVPSSDLARNIARVLAQGGLDPGSLELEVTESVMENADSAIRTLHDLKAMGVHLSIDDFGIGYSSLSHLKRFPIDALRVDEFALRAPIWLRRERRRDYQRGNRDGPQLAPDDHRGGVETEETVRASA